MTVLRRLGGALTLRATAGALALAMATSGGIAQTTTHSAALAPDPVVLELFTSQGCISCPPADALFAKLADEPGVIALSLHVDYWDYLGWEDAFADPYFTARQKRYARAADAKMIYTPQLIIDGVERLQGAREDEIRSVIAQRKELPARVALSISRTDAGLSIAAEADPPLSRPALIHVVRYLPSRDVAIERGENAGKSMSYRNIVSSWSAIAEWGGQAPLNFTTEMLGDEPVVVIVQEQGPGPVLAVAQLNPQE